MRDTLAACEAAARGGGFTPGLALALRTARPAAPPGHVGGYPADMVPAGAVTVPNRLGELEGVRFARTAGSAAAAAAVDTAHGPAAPAGVPASGPATAAARSTAAGATAAEAGPRRPATMFAALLGAVRVGVARTLVDDAVAHLSDRTGGGEPLIRKQLVLGTVADVRTGLEAVLRLLRVAGDRPAAVAEAHERITALDWESAKLLGASGFLAGGPFRAAHVGRLVADCWTAHDTAEVALP